MKHQRNGRLSLFCKAQNDTSAHQHLKDYGQGIWLKKACASDFVGLPIGETLYFVFFFNAMCPDAIEIINTFFMD